MASILSVWLLYRSATKGQRHAAVILAVDEAHARELSGAMPTARIEPLPAVYPVRPTTSATPVARRLRPGEVRWWDVLYEMIGEGLLE